MAILPISDNNPLRHIHVAYVTCALIAGCIIVFLFQLGISERAELIFVHTFGAIPGAVFGIIQTPSEFPTWATLLSHMFLHGGFMHLAGNMLFLWVLGDNVEDALGHARYVLFYSTCGVLAALTHGITNITSTTPMIGASGAISGIIGAYLVLHPKAPIKTLIWVFIVELPTWTVLGIWIVLQFSSAIMTAGGADGGAAWWAHIGGLIAGVVLIIPLRRRGIPLFDGGAAPQSSRRGPRITMRPGPWSRRPKQ